jgi:hypothetical protein
VPLAVETLRLVDASDATVIVAEEELSARFASFSALRICALLTIWVPTERPLLTVTLNVLFPVAPIAREPRFHTSWLPLTVQPVQSLL